MNVSVCLPLLCLPLLYTAAAAAKWTRFAPRLRHVYITIGEAKCVCVCVLLFHIHIHLLTVSVSVSVCCLSGESLTSERW